MEKEKFEILTKSISITIPLITILLTVIFSLKDVEIKEKEIELAKVQSAKDVEIKEKEIEIKEKEIELTEAKNNNDLELKQLELDRNWDMKALDFVFQNRKLIFPETNDGQQNKNANLEIDNDYKRIQKVIVVVFPERISAALYAKITESASEKEREQLEAIRKGQIESKSEAWNGSWSYVFKGKNGLYLGVLKLTVNEDYSVTGNGSIGGTKTEIHIKGNLSYDASQLYGTWGNTKGQEGNLRFKISEDRNFFSGAYSTSLEKEADENLYNTWEGKKIKTK